MLVEHCTEQASKTLDEFYEEVSRGDGHVNREGGGAMLDLIARLRGLSQPERVWGLTSHHRLCLLAHDTFSSPWYVVVAALDRNNYSIEYLMPTALAPWPGASVRGEAHSEKEAVQMILIAMDRSGGWISTQ